MSRLEAPPKGKACHARLLFLLQAKKKKPLLALGFHQGEARGGEVWGGIIRLVKQAKKEAHISIQTQSKLNQKV